MNESVAWLASLMHCPMLARNTKIGPEARECLAFANRMRELTLTRKMNAVWLHIPNEGKRSLMAGALLRALGLIPGSPDFLVAGNGVTGFLEFKSKRGKQTPTQVAFARWCAVTSCRYAVVYSSDVAIQTLVGWGVIL